MSKGTKKKHFCFLLIINKKKSFGQLGQGNTISYGDEPNEMGDNLPFIDLGTGRSAKQITTSYHTCVLLDNDQVKCFGRNE